MCATGRRAAAASTTSAATPSSPRDTFSPPSRRAWSATLDRDPNFDTDRLASAMLEFPGGRHLTFTVATQSSAHQRVTIVGDAGRIEVMIPFNAPPDRPTEIVIDSGADLIGGGRAGRAIRRLRSVYAAGRRVLPRDLSKARRSNSQSRTRSPTCASSTPCSARPRRACGRSRKRLLGLPRRPNTTRARIRRKPTKEKESKLAFFFAFFYFSESGLFNGLRPKKVEKILISFGSRAGLCCASFQTARRPPARPALKGEMNSANENT